MPNGRTSLPKAGVCLSFITEQLCICKCTRVCPVYMCVRAAVRIGAVPSRKACGRQQQVRETLMHLVQRSATDKAQLLRCDQHVVAMEHPPPPGKTLDAGSSLWGPLCGGKGYVNA